MGYAVNMHRIDYHGHRYLHVFPLFYLYILPYVYVCYQFAVASFIHMPCYEWPTTKPPIFSSGYTGAKYTYILH